MMATPSSSNAYSADQWVRVNVSPTKTEVGQIIAVNPDGTAVVATGSGFDLSVKQSQLQRVFLLILDLNGVLVQRKKQAYVTKRPFLDDFLRFAFKNFVVGVWSSCEARNGRRIVAEVFQSQERRLAFQFFRSECTPNPTKSNPYGTIKNLQLVWDRFPTSFNVENTIIVDDSKEKCSHPQNALVPVAFDGTDAATDTGLQLVIEVLSAACTADSIDPVREAMGVDKATMVEQAAAIPVVSHQHTQEALGCQGPPKPGPAIPLTATPPVHHGSVGGSLSADPSGRAAAVTASQSSQPSSSQISMNTVGLLAAVCPGKVHVGGYATPQLRGPVQPAITANAPFVLAPAGRVPVSNSLHRFAAENRVPVHGPAR